MIDKQAETGERDDISSLSEGAHGIGSVELSPCDQTQQKPPKGHVAPKVGAGAKHYRENAYAQ